MRILRTLADFEASLAGGVVTIGNFDGVHVGLVFSCEQFYSPRPELLKPMIAHGCLGIEMEASALYTLAAGFGRKALAICTISDHIVTGEETTTQEREQTFRDMVEIALAAFVLDHVAEIDDQIGFVDVVHALDEALSELASALGELAQFALVVGARTEVDVADQREAHRPRA